MKVAQVKELAMDFRARKIVAALVFGMFALGAGFGFAEPELAEGAVQEKVSAKQEEVSKKAASKEEVSKKAASKDEVSKKEVSKKEVSKKEASKEEVSKKEASGKDEVSKEKEGQKEDSEEGEAGEKEDSGEAVEDGEAVAVAKPVNGDPVRLYGWKEYVVVEKMEHKLLAKMDTGALTSSIHAEEKELFERDGEKWVRFILSDPTMEKPVRERVEAPLVRVAKIKEPGGESEVREVVRLSFKIGERKVRGEFSLNNRGNMNAPMLIGRSLLKDLGWVDPGRVFLAEKEIFR